MKAIIEFNLPDDEYEYEKHIKLLPKMMNAFDAYDTLRNFMKYNNEKTLESATEVIEECMDLLYDIRHWEEK